MNHFKTLFFLLVWTLNAQAVFSQAVWNNTSFVHRDNRQIRDGQNQAISLNGVNLGGWLMWEGWIWGGGYTQEKTIYNNIKSVIGTTAADAFTDSVYHTYITRADIKKISGECFNVVRIPFNHKLLEDDATPYVYKPAGWAVLDSVLKWCEDYNVYAVLDLHSAPGGQSPGFTADPDFLITLWNGAVNQKRTSRLWKAIASRYKNRGIIAGYDLLNEPSVNSDSTMMAVYRAIIDSVRTVDTNHMLFIEGNDYAQDFSMYTSLPDPNVCFQFHFYTWFFPNAVAANLQAFTQLGSTMNVPVWCGEWGENNVQQLDTTMALLKNPSYQISGHAFWTWKKMRFLGSTYPYYTGIDTTSAWNKTIKWVSNTSQPMPTVSEMQTGIAQFLHNIRLQQCSFSTGVSGIVGDCTPAALGEAFSSEGIGVYPNPFSDRILVISPESIDRYILRDAGGKIIGEGTQPGAEDWSRLAPGLYFLELRSGSERYHSKLIKLDH